MSHSTKSDSTASQGKCKNAKNMSRKRRKEMSRCDHPAMLVFLCPAKMIFGYRFAIASWFYGPTVTVLGNRSSLYAMILFPTIEAFPRKPKQRGQLFNAWNIAQSELRAKCRHDWF